MEDNGTEAMLDDSDCTDTGDSMSGQIPVFAFSSSVLESPSLETMTFRSVLPLVFCSWSLSIVWLATLGLVLPGM